MPKNQTLASQALVALAAAAIAAAGMSTGAQARISSDVPVRAGPRVAVLGGLDRTDGAAGSGAASGAYYAVLTGYDWRLGPLIAGVEGDVGGSTARQSIDERRATQGVFATAAVRAGFHVAGRVNGFARAGYAYHRVGYDRGSDFTGHGFTAGGGTEIDLSRQMFARVEYRYSDYGEALRGQQLLGGLGWRF